MSQTDSSDGESAQFIVRWRGKQEGPFSAEIIDAKLEANKIGLLHEIYFNGEWVTIRDYMMRKEAVLRAELQTQKEDEQRQKEEDERQSKAREEQRQTELLAEERRKNDLLQASIAERQRSKSQNDSQPIILKSHRAGTILALGLIGLFICGPLCIAAWLMGDSDIREMDAGIMDRSGRSTTSTGRTLGILGSILWIIGIVCFIVF
jgi:hypothetical protein